MRQGHDTAEREIEEVARDYLLKGRLLTLSFRFAEATKAYETAVAIAPDSYEANFALAYFSQSLNRYDQALAPYNRCLNLSRQSGNADDIARVLNNLGILHRAQNRMDEARKAYEEALTTYRKWQSPIPKRICQTWRQP